MQVPQKFDAVTAEIAEIEGLMAHGGEPVRAGGYSPVRSFAIAIQSGTSDRALVSIRCMP
ncbi:hypothetical protein AB0J71_46430 [Nonomuraea sp. NPDC049637]|uniref:hypothetical protein n=1 Tax=Nonomuraea sp. NPDC049637 TaxID=3154356 RepID=UPI00344A0B11